MGHNDPRSLQNAAKRHQKAYLIVFDAFSQTASCCGSSLTKEVWRGSLTFGGAQISGIGYNTRRRGYGVEGIVIIQGTDGARSFEDRVQHRRSI